eukprot:12050827-Alexandrium_andersonii.AAC.1
MCIRDRFFSPSAGALRCSPASGPSTSSAPYVRARRVAAPYVVMLVHLHTLARSRLRGLSLRASTGL